MCCPGGSPEAWKIKMRRIVLAATLLTSWGFTQEPNKTISLTPSPFTVGAYVETYYSYDLNNLIGNTKPSFLYNFNKNNEVAVNLAFIKGAYVTSRLRANLALAGDLYQRRLCGGARHIGKFLRRQRRNKVVRK